MNDKGNPDIAKYGDGTKFTSGCPAAVEAGRKGALAGHENARRRKTFRELASVYGEMTAEELEGKTNNEAVIVALYKQAKNGNVQAIDKLFGLFGELVFKGEFQMTPAEFLKNVQNGK